MKTSQSDLERDPFSDQDIEGLFYPGGGRAELRDELLHSLRYAGSLVILKGPTGVGKSTLVQALCAELPDDTHTVQINANVFAQIYELLEVVQHDLGLHSLDESQWQSLLEDYSNNRQHLLIVIRSAEALSQELWRFLARSFTDHSDVLHLLFTGTDRIVHPQLASVDIQEWQLPPLSRLEVRDYIAYRLATAGWRTGMPFSDQQISQLYALSGGLPRAINEQASLMFVGLSSEPVRGRRMQTPRMQVILLSFGVVLIGAGIYLWAVSSGQSTTSKSATAKVDAGGRVSIPLATPLADKDKEKKESAADIGQTGTVVRERFRMLGDADQAKTVSSGTVERDRVPLPGATERGDVPAAAPENSEIDRSEPSVAISVKPTSAKPTSADEAVAIAKSAVKPASSEKHVEPAAPETELAAKSALPTKVSQVEPEAAPAPAPTTTPTTKAKPQATVKAKPAPSYTRAEQELLQKASKNYTIQLLAVTDAAKVERYKKSLEKPLTVRQYRRYTKGRLWYVLVYGEYATSGAARSAIERLPAAAKSQKPWPKRLSAVQSEIGTVPP